MTMTLVSIAMIAAGGLFIVYVIFGYPLILRFLSRHFAKTVKKGPANRSISFLIAVRNGEDFLETKIRSILALRYPRHLMEIIVISDGSVDRTDSIAEALAPEGVTLLRVPPGGKAAALNAGMRIARNDFLVFTDVRQILDPDSLGPLLDNFADPTVGVVSGALEIHQGDRAELNNTGLYWRYELWIRDQLSQLDSIFGATGAYYAVRRELAVPIPDGILLDDMYLPLAAFFRGYRLIVETQSRAYDYATDIESEFRRKVRTLAGNYQILKAYPALLGPRNRLWFHYWSYKFARLLLPFALILIFAASFGLPDPWRTGFAGAQVLFYLLAVLDRWIPDASPVKRLTSIVRTFVALMVAGLWAVRVFFVPSTSLWKQTRVERKA